MMTKIIYIFTSLLVLFSCSPVVYSQLVGKYESTNKDSKTTIVFKEDGRFTFSQNNMGVIRTCSGKWELVSNEIINIKCDDQSGDLGKVLSSGYMEPLKEEVFLKGRRKIKMGAMVLVRQQE